MNYEYNPAEMLKIRLAHNIRADLDKVIAELPKHGQKINPDVINAEDLAELLDIGVVVRDGDDIILNPEIFIF